MPWISTVLMQDARCVGNMVDIVLVLQASERIGGRAKNISACVIFLVTGKEAWHQTLENIAAEILADR